MSETELDLLVLGSGVAGLSAAVRASEQHGMRVGVLTKGELHQATTRWAQGGVAAVLGGDDPDSTDLHLADTLAAGAACATRRRAGAGRRGAGSRQRAHRPRRDLRRRRPGQARARPRRRSHPGAGRARRRRGDRRGDRAGAGRSGARDGGGDLREVVRARLHRRERPLPGCRRASTDGSPSTFGRPTCSSPPVARVSSTPSPPTRPRPPATVSRWHCVPVSRSPTSSSSSSTRPRCTTRPCRGRCCPRRCAATARCCATPRASSSSTSCCRATRCRRR